MLKGLREASVARTKEWQKGADVPLSFYSTELAEEAGEVCGAIKRLERHRLGMVGGSDDLTNLKEEIGDVIICIERIAQLYDIDLEECVRSKFNQTSEKYGLKTRIEE